MIKKILTILSLLLLVGCKPTIEQQSVTKNLPNKIIFSDGSEYSKNDYCMNKESILESNKLKVGDIVLLTKEEKINRFIIIKIELINND
jgi:magnesium-transporting ATPase (P-type)